MKYRDQPILKSAIDFARSGQVRAVSTVLERYGSELKCFYFEIISLGSLISTIIYLQISISMYLISSNIQYLVSENWRKPLLKLSDFFAVYTHFQGTV